ncbi:type II toxin-antitoxin system YoeB family toxin [Mucilaginibacter sp.]
MLIEVKENSFEGIGKPEQLKHQYSGKWSTSNDLCHG